MEVFFARADFSRNQGSRNVHLRAHANRFLQRIEYSNGNKGVLATTPVRFGSMEVLDYNKLPTGVGCDTDSVLEDMGMSKEEIEKLKENKVVAG